MPGLENPAYPELEARFLTAFGMTICVGSLCIVITGKGYRCHVGAGSKPAPTDEVRVWKAGERCNVPYIVREKMKLKMG